MGMRNLPCPQAPFEDSAFLMSYSDHFEKRLSFHWLKKKKEEEADGFCYKNPHQKTSAPGIFGACPLSAWLQTWHALLLMSEVYGRARHRGLTTHPVCSGEIKECTLQGRNRVTKC